MRAFARRKPGLFLLGAAATAGVESVLALSAITTRQLNGSSVVRKRWRRRTLSASPASSSRTGTTISIWGRYATGGAARAW